MVGEICIRGKARGDGIRCALMSLRRIVPARSATVAVKEKEIEVFTRFTFVQAKHVACVQISKACQNRPQKPASRKRHDRSPEQIPGCSRPEGRFEPRA